MWVFFGFFFIIQAYTKCSRSHFKLLLLGENQTNINFVLTTILFGS